MTSKNLSFRLPTKLKFATEPTFHSPPLLPSSFHFLASAGASKLQKILRTLFAISGEAFVLPGLLQPSTFSLNVVRVAQAPASIQLIRRLLPAQHAAESH